MYLAQGVTLALAWFLAINVISSAAIAFAARRLRRRACLLLALRLLPAALSTTFVAAVFIPSYWRFEPRDSVEGFAVTLTTFAALAAAVLVAAATRGAHAWGRAIRRARVWTQTAEPFAIAGVNLPTFRIEAPQPLMALVGIVRPRLIVTRGLIENLTPEEVAAGAAHEVAHHRAWDNLKRLVMRGAPDVLHWMPAARRLEREWAAAAEHNADAAAPIVASRAARLALASALVKVARLMPAPARTGEPISTLVGGGAIASRVRRLIDETPNNSSGSPRRTLRVRWCVASIGAGTAACLVGYEPLLQVVHRATELVVRHLP